MSDKRLWHRKSSLKPAKLFEMKEKIGYIEQREKIKEKKEIGKSKNDTSQATNAKSWTQIHNILSSWCAAAHNIPVCLMGFGFSPFGNKFKVHRPREPSGEDCADPWYLKTLTPLFYNGECDHVFIAFFIAHSFMALFQAT